MTQITVWHCPAQTDIKSAVPVCPPVDTADWCKDTALKSNSSTKAKHISANEQKRAHLCSLFVFCVPNSEVTDLVSVPQQQGFFPDCSASWESHNRPVRNTLLLQTVKSLQGLTLTTCIRNPQLSETSVQHVNTHCVRRLLLSKGI